jgi:SAM-dependent methyltransferase
LEHVICNLCEADDFSPYTEIGRFRIVRCNKCGLFHTSPRRSQEETSQLYSEGYFTSDDPSTLGYDDYSSHAAGLRQVFSDNLAIIESRVRPPASVLDVGCALGYFIEVAMQRGWSAEGVEISAYASQATRERTGATVRTGVLKSAGLDASSFDVVTMWDILEHTLDPSGELAEARRALKPGGYLFMTVPDAGALPARLMGRHWFGFKSAAEHNYFFSRDTIDGLLEKAGLKLVETRRGVWPCSARFLAAKLGPYSPLAQRMAGALLKWLRMEDKIVRFKFIDMFVIAKKDDEAEPPTPDP